MKNQNYVHRLVHENEGLLFHLSGDETLASAYVVPDDSQARVAWCQSWKLPVEVLAFHNLRKSADLAHGFFAVPHIPLHSLHKHIHKEASGFLVEEFTLGVSFSEFSSQVLLLGLGDFFGDCSCVLNLLLSLSNG